MGTGRDRVGSGGDMRAVKAWQNGLRAFLGLVMCALCLYLSGCGGVAHKGLETAAEGPETEMEPSTVMVEKENLSMADSLRDGATEEYILGPEDAVEVSVFMHPEMKMECTISATGWMSYYLAGDIQAAGLTEFELRDLLQERLERFIKEPAVMVRISEYRSRKVFVLGQTKNPGVYPMRNRFTLLEAISSAGGTTPDAHLGGAYLVRDGKVLLVNFRELIEKGNTMEDIPLESGDVIYIPDNREQKVFVLGEVNRQSAVPMGKSLTLLEAIAEAGGFTQDADKKTILVMRGDLSEPDIMTVNAQGVNIAANVPLERGDIVYVSSSGFADAERAALRISHILQPFLQVARGIILTDTAVDVLDSGPRNTSVVVSD